MSFCGCFSGKSSTLPRKEELINQPLTDPRHVDLVTEVNSLKQRVSATQREKDDLEDKLSWLQRKVEFLQDKLNDRNNEVLKLHGSLTKRGIVPPHASMDNSYTTCTDKLDRIVADYSLSRTSESGETLERLRMKHAEIDRLKKAVDTLVAANEEKDSRIEELRNMVKTYQRVEDIILSSSPRVERPSPKNYVHEVEYYDNDVPYQGNNFLDDTEILEFHHIDMRNTHNLKIMNSRSNSVPRHVTGSLPVTGKPPLPAGGRMSPLCIPGSYPSNQRSLPPHRSNSFGEPRSSSRQESPSSMRHNLPDGSVATGGASPYSSMRGKQLTVASSNPCSSPTSPWDIQSSQSPWNNTSVSASNSPLRIVPGSSPSSTMTANSFSPKESGLGTAQSDEEAIKDELAQEYRAMQNQSVQRMQQQQQQQQQLAKKSSGIGKLFGRLRRSNSQDLDVTIENGKPSSQFQRTAMRATLGARLAGDGRTTDASVPFANWDGEQVAAWMHGIGLSMYVGEIKRWVRSGQQLLVATIYDLVKELGIRNHLHRKKLQLALQAMATNAQGLIHRLDYHWVTKWLDDIGLPQYKDTFAEARVDGRMLHYMTAEDLIALHVTSALHHLSIKASIQVLRLNDFNPTCFKRRPLPDDGPLENCPNDVMLWTNHRVMEWLRSIDLAEYAANLRGSGVHGALMVFEPHFGAELFASLLSIPASKTLLRRHLSTHFVTLIGNETQQRKRQAESEPGYVPITPNQRVKLKKFATMFNRRDVTLEPDDLLCPLSKEMMSTLDRNGHNSSNMAYMDPESDQLMDLELDKYMHSLTMALARDEIFHDVPTSNV